VNPKSPRHHLPPELLLEYAAGTALPTTSLLVACHLTLCSECRQEVERYQEIGATLLEQQPETGVTEDAFARIMAAIDTPFNPPTARQQSLPEGEGVIPFPLLNALDERQLKLRWALPGVHAVSIMLDQERPPARFVKFRPGIRIPSHGHAAPEILLILGGVLEQEDTQFRRGDVVYSDIGTVHEQVIGDEGSCLALIVNEGPLIPTTRWGKILKRIMGLP
jgi:putative transcriptional regulator